MRFSGRVLAVIVVTMACPGWIGAKPATATAACAGPSITVAPTDGPPGGTVTITGTGFSDTCDDTRSLQCQAPAPELPTRRIQLVLVGPDRDRVLATADGPRFEHKVAIPPETPPGEATIEARIGGNRTLARPVPLTITDSEPVQPQPLPARQPQPPAPGYILTAGDGGVFAFGARQFHGSAAGLDLNAPVVGVASSPLGGYWLAAGDGGVFSFGPAEFRGAAKHDFGCGPSVVGPVVAIAGRPPRIDYGTNDGQGYWTTTRRGYVFSFNAEPYGAAFPSEVSGIDTGSRIDHGTFVAVASHPAGQGYWQATANGGVFAFGEAPFAGSLAGVALGAPIVAMVPNSTGNGYWLAAADGGVFAFGDAPFHGSLGGQPLNAPVVGIAAAPDGDGYWLTAADGGVFAFGSAPFLGSLAGAALNSPVVGITT